MQAERNTSFLQQLFDLCCQRVGQSQIRASSAITYQQHFKQSKPLSLDQPSNHLKNKTQVKSHCAFCTSQFIKEIVQGFLFLNLGKQISSVMRSKINEMIGNATCLEEIKQVQKNAIKDVGDSILKMRANSVEIITQVNLWREYLRNLSEEFCASQTKIIFPAPSQINCCLLPLYDQGFILESLLSQKLSISKENNPFMLVSNIQQGSSELSLNFKKAIEKDQVDYDSYVKMIEKQIGSIQRPKIGQSGSQKIRKQSLSKEKRKQKEWKYDNNKNKSPQINSLIDVESIQQKYQQQTGQKQQQTISNINSARNDKSIIQLTKTELKQSQEKNENMFADKVKAILNQKAELEHQLKQAKFKNKQYEGMINKIERNQVVTNKRVNQKQQQPYSYDRNSKNKSIQHIYQNLTQKNKTTNIHSHQQTISPKTHKKSLSKLSKTPTDQYKNELLEREEKKKQNNVISDGNNVSMFNQNMYESKLNEERSQKFLLEKNFKQLLKQKTKLERVIEKNDHVLAKQKEQNQRKIDQYEQTIQKLQQQKSKLEANLQINGEKNTDLRINTLWDMKQQEKASEKRFQKHGKHSKGTESSKMIKQLDDVFDKRLNNHVTESRSLNKIEIVNTQKTIQIIYTHRNSIKSKVSATQSIKESVVQQTQNYFENSKQKRQQSNKSQESLFPKLNRTLTKLQKESKRKSNKVIVKNNVIDRYRSVVETSKQKKLQIQGNIKSLKKDIYEEFEEKLKNEKQKYIMQNNKLILQIQKQKQSNIQKQKYLSNQIKVLKTMQKNQNHLLNLLQIQKNNRIHKEMQLANQIQKKQNLQRILSIQFISQNLHSQINHILNQQTTAQLQTSKLEQLIQQINQQQNAQLRQMDEQNEKLKNLIATMKAEQNSLISVIKKSIEDDKQFQKLNSVLNPPSDQQVRQDIQQKTETSNIFEHSKNNVVNEKNDIDWNQKGKSTEKMKQNDKDEQIDVENLVQMYLHQPHQYPQNKTQNYSKNQKQQIQTHILNKSRMVIDFQKQLLALKKVQNATSNQDNGIIIDHLRNVKKDYDSRKPDELRKHLFPQTQYPFEYQYNGKDQTQKPQVSSPKQNLKSTRKVVEKKNRSKSNKNFLSANKMKLAQIQQGRKQKQKKVFEEEAKKRNQAQTLKRKIKQKQQHKSSQSPKGSPQKKKLNVNEKKETVETVTLHEQKQPQTMHKSNKFSIKSGESVIKLYVEDDKSQISKVEITSNFDNLQKHEQFTIQQGENEDYSSKYIQTEQNQQKQDQQDLRTLQKGQRKVQESSQNVDVRVSDNFVWVGSKQNSLLKSDVKEYQNQIQEYMNNRQQYSIIQQFVQHSQISKYLQQLTLPNQSTKSFNCHTNISQQPQQHPLLLILVAINKSNGSQVGFSIFHKQHQQHYICDYVMVHNMKNFLTFALNVSKYIFNNNQLGDKIQFFFDLHKLKNNPSWVHFLEFEEKCKRMGKVYVKKDDEHIKKYVLRRNLFQTVFQNQQETKPVNFASTLRVHKDYLQQKGAGFQNTIKTEYISSTVLLSLYLKKNKQMFQIFKKSCEEQLKYRQLLLTTMMFQNQNLSIQNCTTYDCPMQQRIDISKRLSFAFNIHDPTLPAEQLRFNVENSLNNNTKRVTLQLQQQRIKYLVLSGDQSATIIQSSNSCQRGVFLDILPKYKVIVIEAREFIEMCKINHEMNAFFYVKHFFKNICNVQKQDHSKIFIPEIYQKNQLFLPELSQKTSSSIFINQSISLGWGSEAKSSIVYVPSHKDLVIGKPFIISVLSETVEKVSEGTPLFATVIF